MHLLVIGLAAGWIITGLFDALVSFPRAYRHGYQRGAGDTVRQVAGW